MHVIVVGCGRVGSGLAMLLSKEGHSVAVLDKSPRAFRRLKDWDGPCIVGSGFDRDDLEKAGALEAGALAAVTSGDNTNILTVRIARETYKIPHVVARIYDPRRAEIYQRLGIPTVATVTWTIDQVRRRLLPDESAGEWSDATGRLTLIDRSLPDDWAGRPLSELEEPGRSASSPSPGPAHRASTPASWSARRATSSTSPCSTTPASDLESTLSGFAGHHAGRATREGRHRRCGQRRHLHRRRTSRRAGTTCSSSSRIPTRRAAAPDPRRHLVAADACEVSSLDAAGLATVDVVVAATGDDEDNLVISLLAKQEFAVPRVVARVNHPKNQWLFNESWGVDVSVSTPQLITALVEEAVSVGSLVRLLQFQGGAAHLVEVTLAEDSPANDTAIADLDFPRDASWSRSSGATDSSCPGATPCSSRATRCSCSSPPRPRRPCTPSSSLPTKKQPSRNARNGPSSGAPVVAPRDPQRSRSLKRGARSPVPLEIWRRRSSISTRRLSTAPRSPPSAGPS